MLAPLVLMTTGCQSPFGGSSAELNDTAYDPFVSGADDPQLAQASPRTRNLIKQLAGRHKDDDQQPSLTDDNGLQLTGSETTAEFEQAETKEPGLLSSLTPSFGGGSGLNSGNVDARRGMNEYVKANAAYKAGDFSEAEKRFKRIVDIYEHDEFGMRKRTFRNWMNPKVRESHYIDNPLREDALFYMAESRYQQQKFPGAGDAYLRLLNAYPSSRHMDTATRRMFAIAGLWMELKVTDSGDIVPASYEPDGKTEPPKIHEQDHVDRPSFINLTDGKRPGIDIEGRALELLKSIWLHDPTGPLADDALMLTASHQLRVGHHADAKETYRLLREEYPNSPHFKDAFILGSYVTQASYLGSDYDGKSLVEARNLKATALRIFNELTPEERSRLQTELNKIDEAAVKRDYDRALFYMKKQKYNAVVIYCTEIIRNYPNSEYAGKAKQLMADLENRKKQNPLLAAVRSQFSSDEPTPNTQPDSETPPTLQPVPSQSSSPGRSKVSLTP